MRQKVALAGALVHEPRLIILDEPLTGLDAVSARHVKGLLGERVRNGCTVIMTTHILEVAERMADRIGVIAAGRLVAEGTLAELRQRAAGTIPASRRCSSPWSMSRLPRHECIGGADLVRAARIPAGVARMARHDDRRPPLKETHRDRRAPGRCGDPACAGLCGGRQVREPAAAARQAHAHRHHHVDFPGLGLDAVAGDRIRDAGVLRSRRPRSDHVVARRDEQRVFGPHRGDLAVGHRDGAAAVDALRRRPGDRRRRALVLGLWRRDHDRPFGGGHGGGRSPSRCFA